MRIRHEMQRAGEEAALALVIADMDNADIGQLAVKIASIRLREAGSTRSSASSITTHRGLCRMTRAKVRRWVVINDTRSTSSIRLA